MASTEQFSSHLKSSLNGSFRYYFSGVSVYHRVPDTTLHRLATNVVETERKLKESSEVISAVILESPYMAHGIAFGGSLLIFQGHEYVAAVHRAIELGRIGCSYACFPMDIYRKSISLFYMHRKLTE